MGNERGSLPSDPEGEGSAEDLSGEDADNSREEAED